jgi:methanogenic corrinoid protein MtbC1
MSVQEIYQDYLDALLDGNRAKCHTMVQSLIDTKTDVRDIYLNLFKRSLYEVGELWQDNKISVSHEHLATALTESLMNLVYPLLFSAEHINKTVIVSCSYLELHQVGAKMIADVFELNRWHAYFLGANTPVEDLITMIDEVQPNVIALSVSIYFNIPALESTIRSIRLKHPELPIIVGGQAFIHGGQEITQKFHKVQFIGDINELENHINSL